MYVYCREVTPPGVPPHTHLKTVHQRHLSHFIEDPSDHNRVRHTLNILSLFTELIVRKLATTSYVAGINVLTPHPNTALIIVWRRSQHFWLQSREFTFPVGRRQVPPRKRNNLVISQSGETEHANDFHHPRIKEMKHVSALRTNVLTKNLIYKPLHFCLTTKYKALALNALCKKQEISVLLNRSRSKRN